MFDRLPEILALLALGLIVFGPKKMIELGGQAGRVWRDLRAAVREMNWNPLGEEESARKTSASPTILGALSQLAQEMTTPPSVDAEPAAPSHVVETSATTTASATTATTPPSSQDAPVE